MKKLSADIIRFLENQGFVIVSTIDGNGGVHNSCKGIVKINQKGEIYLFDLYLGRTYKNLKANPHISITAVDEHKFMGYCLKGKAKEMTEAKLIPQLIKSWDERVTSRLTRRLLKNIHEEKGHPRHPEILLPKPEYLIVMDVEDIIDLTPHPLK
jgi:putative heme iron utilization protein